MINTEEFWRTTGAKFSGTETEWEEVYTGCDRQFAFIDEKGFFNKFICCIDWRECDKHCLKHYIHLK